ncbi:hypothetical protein IV203_028510 [Nitzschia inconspicua]|uniref:Uncharacterized protein n=1 Tax=Nitzschia inconspicua TaxID=303405 RepID=A0A9K3LNS0_9STRA|nr:hypothetical protein IV203_028510 [Nitzschia inconspicua]
MRFMLRFVVFASTMSILFVVVVYHRLQLGMVVVPTSLSTSKIIIPQNVDGPMDTTTTTAAAATAADFPFHTQTAFNSSQDTIITHSVHFSSNISQQQQQQSQQQLLPKQQDDTLTKTTNHHHHHLENKNTTTNATTNHKETKKKYWKYDEAGPTVLYAKTHFLQSIPETYRINHTFLDKVPNNTNQQYQRHLYSLYNLTEYASQPHHQWPHKLHLFEMNPCIAILPRSYQESLRRNHTDSSSSPLPVYIVVYRVTHKHNCYDGNINIQLLGGNWNPTSTDYLGVALLDRQLNILMDSTLNLFNHPVLPHLNDYRIYNLNEQLYLTSVNHIVPLYLKINDNNNSSNNVTTTTSGTVDPSWVPVPLAFINDENNNNNNNITTKNASAAAVTPPFRVWLRNYTSCPVYGQKGSSKNLLYFVSRNSDSINGNHTSNDNNNNKKKNTKHNTRNSTPIRVIHYPRSNPNDVRNVELDTPCGQQTITPFDENAREWYPQSSFDTIDRQLFPRSVLFLADRGSACCIDMVDPTTGRKVMVAIVHPKTFFPGKRLPKGVAPNTYLSRFIAMESQSPYRIVARSGMFCLGYPNTTNDELLMVNDNRNNNNNNNNNSNDTFATTSSSSVRNYPNPIADDRMGPIMFGNVPMECPRIHFVMGMVEKIDHDDADHDDADGSASSSSSSSSTLLSSRVLISYGVSDCLSHIIEISKDEIRERLWPGQNAQ